MRIYHRLLAAVMLACLAVPVGLVVYHVFDIRPISYLPVVVFLAALESMYSHYQMREISITSLKWWAYHLAELLVWIILTKLLLYALYGFDRLWSDLPAWRQDAAIFFNDPEYLFLVVTVIGAWMLSGELESLFSSLEYDEQYLQVEIDTGFSEERMELAAAVGQPGDRLWWIDGLSNHNSKPTKRHDMVGVCGDQPGGCGVGGLFLMWIGIVKPDPIIYLARPLGD